MFDQPIVYVHWRDACYVEGIEGGQATAELLDLEEVGWLLDESDEVITIGMELDEEGMHGRWRLNVPKINIIELRQVDVQKAFPKKSIRQP